MKQHRKPTLLSVRQQSAAAITTRQLADAAGVSLGDTYAVEIGGFTSETTAYKVLRAYEQLTGQKISVKDIRLNSSIVPTYCQPS